jgi:transglutaminase-like putative cysteine protease
VTLLVEATTSGPLLLEQHIRYEYSAPVERLRQRLIVVPPPVHGAQRRRDWSLTVDGVDATVRRTRTDSFGNVVIDIGARRVERWIQFGASAAVERVAMNDLHRIPVDPRFLRPTPLTTADARIRDLVIPGAGPADICARASRSLTYEWGITDVRTSAAEAIRGGRGVCQDFAHIMIAACRAGGIAARYVSGHLVGEGGSHAWVEAMVPDPDRPGEWAVEAWDPTHDRAAGEGYVMVAIGRDYADVAPLSGSYVADRAAGQLSVRKRVVAHGQRSRS